MLYRPIGPGQATPMHVLIHVNEDAAAIAAAVRNVAAAAGPSVRIYDLMRSDEIDRESVVAHAFLAQVLAVVAAVALLLSTAGVYALMSFTAARRTREIGIRIALGADCWRVVTGIFRRALTQLGLGLAAGCVPGTALVGWGAPEISRGAGPAVGVLAFFAVATFMIGVGVLASAVPTRRALAVQPTQALRAE